MKKESFWKEEVFQLRYDEETDRYCLDTDSLHCGDCISVLVWNGLTQKVEWIDTRIEMNRNGWYLEGLIGYQISGLFAKR